IIILVVLSLIANTFNSEALKYLVTFFSVILTFKVFVFSKGEKNTIPSRVLLFGFLSIILYSLSHNRLIESYIIEYFHSAIFLSSFQVIFLFGIFLYEIVNESNFTKKELEFTKIKLSEQFIRNKKEIEVRHNTEHLLIQSNAELEKIKSELDQFLYRVSHDLRAPISSILGLTNLGKNEKDILYAKKYFEYITETAEYQDKVIRDIQDYSANNKLSIHNEYIDMNVLLEETILKFKESEKKQIYYQVNAKIKNIFFSDKKRLEIILNNLISNSIKFSNGNSVYIIVDIVIDHNSARLYLKDNGIGIHKDHIDKIFKMFYRGDNQQKGSGLGLFNTMETLQKLGGKILVESNENQGSLFFLEIPNKARPFKLKDIELTSH
ncbi:MAG: HAMP domain-containing histidine kinase, partial [Cyclobacteriaceae bacterium]|nr:HAMP domain-containing histidine kinase [Cyclobacteriaceae bacterium]